MEMPVYKWPAPSMVCRRMIDSGWAFLRRAGTLILASMVLVWALLYFPHTDANGKSYDVRRAALEGKRLSLDSFEQTEDEVNRLQAEWESRSYLGQMGRALEPLVKPLGWDWRIGMAALASFPAREVMVGTLGIIYSSGSIDADAIRNTNDQQAAAKAGRLRRALVNATWDDHRGARVFNVPVALSIMVFFALCCQCASTLAVIRRETNSWRWPLFTFAYMTALAYAGALVTYQLSIHLCSTI
jgi:ferrous iron transport protein B